MMCCQLLPITASGNSIGNTPSPRPVGCFRSLLPMLPIALLNVVSKEKRRKQAHINARMHVKVLNPIGNSNRQQGGST